MQKKITALLELEEPDLLNDMSKMDVITVIIEHPLVLPCAPTCKHILQLYNIL
jgi:hypothetical protein